MVNSASKTVSMGGKKSWIQALFSDLNPKVTSSTATDATSESSDAIVHDRWSKEAHDTRRRRWSSSPAKSRGLTFSEDDLINKTQQNLRISDGIARGDDLSSRSISPVNGRDNDAIGVLQSKTPFPSIQTSNFASTSSPTMRAPPGPLYSQEVPYYNPVRQWQSSQTRPGTTSIDHVGGFVDPKGSPSYRNTHQASSPPTTTSNATQTNGQASYRPPPTPPGRSQTKSTPVHLPPFLTPPRPMYEFHPRSDPSLRYHQTHQPQGSLDSTTANRTPSHQHRNSSNKSERLKQSLSSSTNSLPAKPNQCHGITGSGKRCMRIVKASNTRSEKTHSPMRNKASEIQAHPGMGQTHHHLGKDVMRQLDRRLSLSKRQGRTSSSNRMQKNRLIIVDLESSDEENLTYFEGGFARMQPIQELDYGDGTDSDDESGLEELPVYCFQHAKQTLDQKGTFVGQKYIEFDDWIPQKLPQETKLQLRHEISKPVSTDDSIGYIYVHEMATKDINASSTTFIKLGRSIKPVARLSQWKSQCKSRQPIVRDIFPLHPSHPLHPDQTITNFLNNPSPSRIHGALSVAAQGCRYHHKWERLCLIELAGIATLQSEARNDRELFSRQKCSDCGKIHVELFLVDRGSYERDIRDLVLRWQSFVQFID